MLSKSRIIFYLLLSLFISTNTVAQCLTSPAFGPGAITESFENIPVSGNNPFWFGGWTTPVTPYTFPSGVTLTAPVPNPTGQVILGNWSLGSVGFGICGSGVGSAADLPNGSSYIGLNNPSLTPVFTFPSNTSEVGLYVESCPGVITLTAYNSSNAVIGTCTVNGTGNVSNWKTNFIGFKRIQGDIAKISINGQYVILDKLTFSPTSISTSVSSTIVCPGSFVNVSYTATGTYNAGNVFTAQLSDANGSFASPTNIGNIFCYACPITNTSGSFSVQIPTATPSGTGYRIRVVSNNPLIIGADNGTNITIGTPIITCPSNITVNTASGQCGANVTFSATTTGSAVIYSMAPGSFFPVGTTTVTASSSNSCGTSTCSFNVTVIDNQPPTAVCKNITLQLDENGQAALTGSPVEFYNYSCDLTTLGFSNVSQSFTATTSGFITKVGAGIGLWGTSVSYGTIITSNSNTVNYGTLAYSGRCCYSPCVAGNNMAYVTLPTPFYVNAGETVTISFSGSGGEKHYSGGQLRMYVTGVTTGASLLDNGSTDACGIANRTIDKSAFDCSNVGSNPVTLTVTDINGNTSTCTSIVTVEDHVAPVAICKSITVQLDATGNATITAADVDNGSHDACGIASLTIDKSNFTCANIGANTVTLTVTDVNGNVSNCTSTVTVEDHVAPVAICKPITLTLDETGNASITAADVNDGSHDACGIASVAIDRSTFTCADIAPSAGSLSLPATVVRDFAGRTVTFSNINVNGTGSNVVTVAPGSTVTVSTNWNSDFTSSYCPGCIQQYYIGVKNLTIDCMYSGGTAWNVTGSGNLNFTAPTTPGVYVVQAESSLQYYCTATPADISDSHTGALAFIVVAPQVTLTVTDVNGNTSTCVSTITIEDHIAPTAICKNVTVQLDATGNASIVAADVDGGSTDACGIANRTIDKLTFDCSNVGPNLVTLTVTDVNENTSTCTSTVTVEDHVAPVAICKSITVQLDATGNATITAADVNDGSHDACGITSLTIDNSNFTCANVGSDNAVTLTVTDVNGNTSSCTSTVTVEDHVDPLAICKSITVQLDAAGNVTITAADVNDGSTDACGIASITIDNSNFTCANVGANTVTLTVTDVNGNVSTCQSTVTVEDPIAPVITGVPADVTVSCDNIPSPEGVSVSDNCSATLSSYSTPVIVKTKLVHNWKADNNFIDVIGGANGTPVGSVSFGPGIIGSNSFAFDGNMGYVSTGVAGSVSGTGDFSVSAWIKTSSNNPMVIIQQRDAGFEGEYILKIGGNHNNSDVRPGKVYFLAYGSGSPVVDVFSSVSVNDGRWHQLIAEKDGSNVRVYIDGTLDASGSTVVPVSFSGSISTTIGRDVRDDASNFDGLIDDIKVWTAGICPSNYEFDRVWVATDLSGNQSAAIQHVTVQDNVGPVLTCPASISVNNTPGQCGANVNFEATATDNCSNFDISYNIAPGSFFPIGTTTVNVTAKDACGNTSECSFEITVIDSESPAITCLENISVDNDINVCGATVNYDTPVGTDNCPNATTVQTAGLSSGSVFPIGTTTNTYVVTDAAGNSTSCSFTVTVKDAEAPKAICKNTVVQLDATGNASITVNDVNNGSTDNCGIASVTIDKSSFTCANVGANTVTLTVTDVNGNVSTCQSTVTVEDHIAPIAICKSITVQLDANGNASITATDINNGSTDACGIASITIDKSTFTCANVGANTVTLTVTDVNGNVSTCQSTVTVQDNIAPVIVCPANIFVQAQRNDCSPIVNWNAPVITENCTYTIVSNHHSGDHFPVGTTTVKYSVVDASGNTATCSFEVTVTPDPLIATISDKTYIGGKNISCKGKNDGEATVVVSGGCLPYTYSWSNGQTGAIATGLVAGTYTVNITDANGTTISKVITLTEPTQLVVNAGNNQTVYYGYSPMACAILKGTATGGTPAYNYAWSNGASTSSTTVCPNVTTTYNVTVTDQNGCIANSSVTVCPIDVRCSQGGNAITKGQGTKVMVCHNSGNGKTQTLCVDASAIPAHLAHGDQLGDCGVSTACFTPAGRETVEQGTQPNVISANNSMNVLAYPNPFNATTTISFNTTEDERIAIRVYNIEGSEIANLFEGDVKAGDVKEVIFNGNELSTGMYFVKVTSASGKLIVSKLMLNK